MIFYRFARALVLSVLKLVFRVRVVGREHVPPEGAYIIAASHRSILDVPLAGFATRRRIRFMAKEELFTSRFGRWLFTKLGAISVARETTDRAALRASQDALAAGEPIAIFPEGTRRSGPAIEDLYDGVSYLATKMGVPIVPVGIGGTQEILPSGTVLPRIHRVAVVIGAPVTPDRPVSDRSAADRRHERAARVRRRSDVAALTGTLQRELQAAFDQANRLVDARPQVRPRDEGSTGRSAAEAREHV